MAHCPDCSSPVRETARFCDRCGAELPAGESASTIGTPGPALRIHVVARFVPGTILGRRYRIVAPLGSGGMGEVYRAEDLKLGQAIALKFLPQSLERDRERSLRLVEEVRAARQVAHPNVCRVWDVGEEAGVHFVTMEYVDGEDLAALLRRVGRLPEDRGVQVAREICSGLAAIHAEGLVHRDLKPSNVMIDGRGHARITDFGLAVDAETVPANDIRSGTPAYMAPEVMEGREVTARSDVYALGLILYELFTGRHGFDSSPTPGRRDPTSQPEIPSRLVRTMDPAVERAILRCLEIDPAARPASATAVAQALPGGDPLAAALSAGETPSPGMVAAAGGVGGLSPLAAVGALAFALAAMTGVLWLSEARGLPFGPRDRSYAVLQDRASELMRAMGSPAEGGQMQDGFSRMLAGSSGATTGTPRNEVFYWQRRSPLALFSVIEERAIGPGSTFAIPALETPGESATRFDLEGRLLEFRRVPSPGDTMVNAPPDWAPLFSAAEITGATALAAGAPRAPAPVPVDARTAWKVASTRDDRRVEGGTYRGRVTYFSVGPSYAPPLVRQADLIGSTITAYIIFLLFAIFLIVARHNLRAGRADLRGAIRIGASVIVLGVFGFLVLRAPQVAWPGSNAVPDAAIGVFFAAFTAMSYLALEPIVRRRRPQWLASWSRLLDGRWSDALVGRDVVIGTVAGLAMALLSGLREYLAGTTALGDVQAAAIGGWTALGLVCRGVVGGMQIALTFALIQVLLRLAVRQGRFAFAAWTAWAVLYVALISQAPHGPPWVALALLQAVIAGVLLDRCGVLALVVASGLWSCLNEEYLTVHLDAWYAGVTIAVLVATALLMAWGVTAGLRTRRDPRVA